jgi:sarcosine oxidase
MTSPYDTIVIGVGAMGSATCYELAKRGKRVLGLERFDIPHARGSSHGYTRIIRLAYYEHPSYVSLLRRSYELWRQVEKEAGEQLLYITGSIDASAADEWVFKGALQSAQQYDLEHEVLEARDLKKRFPGYNLPDDIVSLYQPEGGFLQPERSVVAFANLAMAHGADIRARERVLDFEPTSAGVLVRTDKGIYEASSLVVSAGAWMGEMLPFLKNLAVPERQVLAWLRPFAPQNFQLSNFPVFNLQVPEGRYYGFPIFAVPGFKFGRYRHFEESGDPDRLLSEPTRRDEDMLREFAARYFPDGAGATMSLVACMFTNTPDGHFVIDRHPELPQVFIASPCSGHGFKFASVVGEIMADLATDGSTRHDISLFRLDRFQV